jgi:L-ribulose-5-phosphate 4-epimerase
VKPDKVTDARQHFIATCWRAFSMRLQMSTGGNLSMRIDSTIFLVKPSGKALCDLTVNDLLLCDDRGRVMEGRGMPTKEFNSHLAIYRVQPRTGAIVHYHPPYATAYAAAGRELPLPTVHARRILLQVPLISPPGEGSPEVSAALEKAFSLPEQRAALMEGHGIIAAGSDLNEAQNLAELVEESARIAYLASCITVFDPF